MSSRVRWLCRRGISVVLGYVFGNLIEEILKTILLFNSHIYSWLKKGCPPKLNHELRAYKGYWLTSTTTFFESAVLYGNTNIGKFITPLSNSSSTFSKKSSSWLPVSFLLWNMKSRKQRWDIEKWIRYESQPSSRDKCWPALYLNYRQSFFKFLDIHSTFLKTTKLFQVIHRQYEHTKKMNAFLFPVTFVKNLIFSETSSCFSFNEKWFTLRSRISWCSVSLDSTKHDTQWVQ